MVIKFGKWLTRHKEEGHCGSQRKIEKSESCGGCYLV